MRNFPFTLSIGQLIVFKKVLCSGGGLCVMLT